MKSHDIYVQHGTHILYTRMACSVRFGLFTLKKRFVVFTLQVFCRCIRALALHNVCMVNSMHTKMSGTPVHTCLYTQFVREIKIK